MICASFNGNGEPFSCPCCGANAWTDVRSEPSGDREFPIRQVGTCSRCARIQSWLLSGKIYSR